MNEKKRKQETQIEFLKKQISNLLEKILNEDCGFLIDNVLRRFEERCKKIDNHKE